MRKKNPGIHCTRQSIIDPFSTIAKRRNFKEISIAGITEEANINRSAFYYHFKDKEV
jgi:AcrR family transcriptional regulator